MGPASVIRETAIRRREVPADVYAALPDDMDPVLRRIYAARQVPPAELDMSLAGLLPVGSLGGAVAAAEFLADARRRQLSVLVVGDFDADGATASALVVTALREMGFEHVSYLVPNRFDFGYGLSPAVAELAAARGPDILITVDNGISSIEGVARARSLGMEVIVTDHHLPGELLPGARIIVNPNMPGETFAGKSLCGVGVAFYVMAALARELGRQGLAGYEDSRRAVTRCLDLVALGTVADVVRLDHNNRILVHEGLRRIRAGAARPGLNALLAMAGRDPAAARSADLAFGVAPRLNAAGRLTDMSLGIDCLLAADDRQARQFAARLDGLNRERRELQGRMEAEAAAQLQRIAGQVAGAGRDAVCLFDPGWHQGIVGLVASRVKEETGLPAIAFAPGEEAGVLKGSARSVEGVHIRDVLAAIAARRSVLGMVFGGHAMAAAVRLPAAALDAFRAAFGEEISRQLAGAETGRVLWTDGPLEAGELRLSRAEEMHFAGPWGQGFPEPLFDNEFEVLDQRLLRDAHLRLTLRHTDGGEPLAAIAFQETRSLPARARFLYRLGVNDFGGRRRQQLVVEHVQCE
jgi:single-stranded-DNA-specific exonuclease